MEERRVRDEERGTKLDEVRKGCPKPKTMETLLMAYALGMSEKAMTMNNTTSFCVGSKLNKN